jgi:hypothetical protein
MRRMLDRTKPRARLPAVAIPERTQQELARAKSQRLIKVLQAAQHRGMVHKIPSGSEQYMFGQVVPWQDLVAHPATCECARCKP